MDDLAKQLNITDHDEWYNVSHKVVQQKAGSLITMYNGSLCKLLSSVYPEYLSTQYHFIESYILGRKPSLGTNGNGTVSPNRGVSWTTLPRNWTSMIMKDGINSLSSRYVNMVVLGCCSNTVLCSAC